MAEIVRRLVWFAIVACACAYAIFLVAGSFARARASQSAPLVIHDSLAPGVHNLSGTLTLADSCDNVIVATRHIASTTYQLMFNTWHDDSTPCIEASTSRDFHAVVLAPETGTSFYATLDGAPILVSVVAAAQ